MILEVLEVFLNSVIAFLPKLVGAGILLGIGWLVGVVVGRVTREVLTRLKVDKYVAREKKPAVRLSNVFSVIFKWAVYLVFIQAAVHVLEIPTLVTVLNEILTFIPGLVEAVIIIVAGYVIGEYIERQIVASKVLYSEMVGKAVFFLVLYVAIATALPLVGINPTLINNLLLITAGSVGLGFAIALGLGLKDAIARIAKKKLK